MDYTHRLRAQTTYIDYIHRIHTYTTFHMYTNTFENTHIPNLVEDFFKHSFFGTDDTTPYRGDTPPLVGGFCEKQGGGYLERFLKNSWGLRPQTPIYQYSQNFGACGGLPSGNT